MKQQVYETLSERARSLLNRQEGYDVEFKESLNGITPEDIVAFANSATGGAILVGIRELKTEDGRQRGEIRGCTVGDREKLAISSRAQSCLPPVEVEILVENASDKPFFRVEIPSGSAKPYCTAGGTYKIRGNARTNALTPSKLLAMFMESESQEFLGRFRGAAKALEGELDTLSAKLASLEETVGDLFGVSDEAGSIAQDAAISSEKSREAIEGFRLGAQEILWRTVEIQRSIDKLLAKSQKRSMKPMLDRLMYRVKRRRFRKESERKLRGS